MTDAEFLEWIRNRIVKVYGESENVDFVRRLDKIILSTLLREGEEAAKDVKDFLSGSST